MFTWSLLPCGWLSLEKRLLTEKEWQTMMDCLALYKDALVAVEQPRAADGYKYSTSSEKRPYPEFVDCELFHLTRR